MDWSKLRKTEPEEPEEVSTEGWDEMAAGEDPEPFADPNLAGAVQEQGLDQQGPVFLGLRWRDITDPALKRKAWVWLREWVDGFVDEQRPKDGIIRACWFRHPDAVAELWALANAEVKVWAEGMASTMPLAGFQAQLPAAYARLGSSSMANCHDGEHKEPKTYGKRAAPYALLVDEDLWAEHLTGVQDEEVSLEPGQYRMVAEDGTGARVVSEAVRVEPGPPEPRLKVSTPVMVHDGHGVEGLRAIATGTDLLRTWWEKSDESGQDWERIATSLRDVSSQDRDESADGEDDAVDEAIREAGERA